MIYVLLALHSCLLSELRLSAFLHSLQRKQKIELRQHFVRKSCYAEIWLPYYAQKPVSQSRYFDKISPIFVSCNCLGILCNLCTIRISVIIFSNGKTQLVGRVDLGLHKTKINGKDKI